MTWNLVPPKAGGFDCVNFDLSLPPLVHYSTVLVDHSEIFSLSDQKVIITLHLVLDWSMS